MATRLLKVLAPMAGLAMFTVPGVVTPVVPAQTSCAGGICSVCPMIAKTLSATDAQIYCIA